MLTLDRFLTGIDTDVFGTVHIVKKCEPYSAQQWKAFLYFLLLCIPAFIALSSIVGLPTTAFAAVLLVVKRIQVSTMLKLKYSIETQMDFFALFCFSSLLYLTALLALGSFTMDATIKLTAFLLICPFSWYYHESFIHVIRMNHRLEFPALSYPLSFRYLNEEMKEFSTLRTLTTEHTSLANVMIANPHLEAICSMLVPSEAYNNVRVRFVTGCFFQYILPLLSVIQMLLNLSPPVFKFLFYIFHSVRYDFLVSTFGTIAQLFRFELIDRVGNFVYQYTTNIVAWFSWLAIPFVEFDRWSTYLFARLQMLFLMFVPLIQVGRTLLVPFNITNFVFIFKQMKMISEYLSYLQNRFLRPTFLWAYLKRKFAAQYPAIAGQPGQTFQKSPSSVTASSTLSTSSAALHGRSVSSSSLDDLLHVPNSATADFTGTPQLSRCTSLPNTAPSNTPHSTMLPLSNTPSPHIGEYSSSPVPCPFQSVNVREVRTARAVLGIGASFSEDDEPQPSLAATAASQSSAPAAILEPVPVMASLAEAAAAVMGEEETYEDALLPPATFEPPAAHDNT